MPRVLSLRDTLRQSAAPAASPRAVVRLRDRAMLELLYASGLRVGELVRLDLAARARRPVAVRGTLTDRPIGAKLESMGGAVSDALPIVLRTTRSLQAMSDDEFFEFCQLNRDWRIELSARGELVILPPTGGRTGHQNLRLGSQLDAWAAKDASGLAFDSSTGFSLPDGARRSPDLSWVARDRWDRLSAEQQDRFPPLCPDFVLELRSPSDGLRDLQAKMEEYIESGARLGWLIDPVELKAYVYQPGQAVECLDQPASLSGGAVLRGFVLDLREVWA